jgi:hypothetical protein
MAKPDLSKLKTEIENRKREKSIAPASLGEQTNIGASPRDTFLYGLLESWKTGKETASTNLIKTVDNKVALKKGESSKLQINETIAPPARQHIPTPRETIDMSPERDEQLFHDLESKRKQTLAESMSGYVGKTQPTPMSQSMQTGAPMNLNEQYLNESVKKMVNNYLIENFGPILEESIKDTMLEIYAVERIKAVLNENKDMIKSLVYEIIREIQTKSKNKAH